MILLAALIVAAPIAWLALEVRLVRLGPLRPGLLEHWFAMTKTRRSARVARI